MKHFARGLLGIVCCVFLFGDLIGCSQGGSSPVTQALVTVDSDMRGDIAAVEVQVLDVRAEVVGSSHVFEMKSSADWPVSFAIAPSPGKDNGSFLVTARANDSKGALLAETKGLLTFLPGKTITSALWLFAACRGVTCSSQQTCIGKGENAGTCGAVPVLDTEVAEGKPPSGDRAPPTLTPPSTDDSSASDTDAGITDAATKPSGAMDGSATDADVDDTGVDAQVVVPHAANIPTVGAFSTLGEPRSNAAGRLLVEDGFEFAERSCNAAGLCATAWFAP